MRHQPRPAVARDDGDTESRAQRVRSRVAEHRPLTEIVGQHGTGGSHGDGGHVRSLAQQPRHPEEQYRRRGPPGPYVHKIDEVRGAA